jgi:nitrate/nitrite transporter NarK
MGNVCGESLRTPRIYYGWFIVVSMAAIGFLSSSARGGVYGIFIPLLSEEFDLSRAAVSLPASIAVLSGGLMGPFAGWIFDRFGGRKVITSTLVLLALSIASLRYTNSLIFLIAFYGILAPVFGSGNFMPIIAALVSRWFYRHRATAIGIVLGGTSMGSLFMLPLITRILFITDWRTTWLILGILILVAVPLAAAVVRDDPAVKGLQPYGVPTSGDQHGRASSYGPLEAKGWQQSLRTAPLWQLMGSFAICGFSGMPILIHMIPLGTERGLSPTLAATALGLMGSLNLLGMIFAGPISDRMQRKTLLGLVYIVLALGYLLLLINGPLGIFSFAIVFGTFILCTGLLTMGLTADIYGVRNLGTILGIVLLCHTLAGSTGTYLAGWLHDLTGNYDLAFTIFGICFLGAMPISLSIQERKYSSRFHLQRTRIN